MEARREAEILYATRNNFVKDASKNSKF